MPRRGLRAGVIGTVAREAEADVKANRDLQILVDLRRDLQIIVERQRSRYPSPSSRDLQLSPRADAASNLHVAFRLETWLSALARGDRAQMRWVQKAAEDTTANVTDWMMRWDLARNGLWHASHASCRAGQADAVRGSEDDRVDAAYADAVRISAALPYLQYRIWSGHASHAAGQVAYDRWGTHAHACINSIDSDHLPRT